jgi:CrcB protein
MPLNDAPGTPALATCRVIGDRHALGGILGADQNPPELIAMHSLGTYLLVFLGAGIGGAVRHFVNRSAGVLGGSFTWGTLVVNVTGCLLAGVIAGWFAFRGESSQEIRLFLITGLLGGYTTFSAFSLEVVLLWERGQPAAAILYALGSVVLSVLLLFLGMSLMRA